MFRLRYNLALLTLLLLPSLAAANVIISEVLADPPGDANYDGQYDPHEDEFIELYNAGSRRVSLAGWRLGDAGSLSRYFRFPSNAVIEPGSYVVLFGGGKSIPTTAPSAMA
ncbi:MAG: lamin tail domain-containing protein [Candidatus Latescibacteria bacterium]|nr:lamin tail domain-containing protein [Candidatus Latescibacterota bacterium]